MTDPSLRVIASALAVTNIPREAPEMRALIYAQRPRVAPTVEAPR